MQWQSETGIGAANGLGKGRVRGLDGRQTGRDAKIRQRIDGTHANAAQIASPRDWCGRSGSGSGAAAATTRSSAEIHGRIAHLTRFGMLLNASHNLLDNAWARWILPMLTEQVMHRIGGIFPFVRQQVVIVLGPVWAVKERLGGVQNFRLQRDMLGRHRCGTAIVHGHQCRPFETIVAVTIGTIGQGGNVNVPWNASTMTTTAATTTAHGPSSKVWRR